MVPDPDTPLTRRERMAALLLLAAFCLTGLFDHSLWSANDTREGAMIREMVRTGHWVTPILNGQAYLEKPPLLHWTGAMLCRLAGTVNEGLVRLPAALFGFGSLLIIYQWGRRLGRERGGLAAAYLCATSILFLEYSRIVLTDAALTFMVMWSWHLFWNAYTAKTRIPLRYGLFILVSALSFYAKGLLGPGFVWVAVGLFLLYQRKWKLAFMLPALFLPVLACVVAPWAWALWRTGGREFLVTAFWANQFGRFLTFSDASLPPDPYFVHKEPIYFYLLHLPVRLLPWTLLAAAALARWFQRRSAFREPLTVFMRLALVAMLLVLHVSAAKAACYLMPTLPIIFLMTGCWLEHGTAHGLRRAERWLIKVSFGIVAFLALALPAGYAAAYLAHVRQVWAPAGCTATAALIFALLALGLGLRALVKFWPEFRAELNLPALNRALMVLVAVFILDAAAVLPALDYQRDYRPFAALVRQARAAGRRVAAAGLKEREAAAFAFYADTRLDVIELDGRVRTYLLAPDQPAAVVVQRKQLAAVSNLLEGVAFTCQESAHGGYKSRQFALIMPTGSNP